MMHLSHLLSYFAPIGTLIAQSEAELGELLTKSRWHSW
jgi:hypothetical protein